MTAYELRISDWSSDVCSSDLASGALVSQPVQHPHVLVPDTMRGLEALGIASRARAAGRIAGITGRVGKTGTKDALRLALERSAPRGVHASVTSYNNHTGELGRASRRERVGHSV